MAETKREISLVKPDDSGAGARQFGHLNVRERVIDTGDRAISIGNIATISILTRIEKGKRDSYFVVAGIVTLIGLSLLFGAIGNGPRGGAAPLPLALAILAVAGMFIWLGIRSKDTSTTYLTIATNDGSRTIFPSADRAYLSAVKDFIADKINRDDEAAVQYFDNRSTHVRAATANIGTDQSVYADALVVGDNNWVAARSAGASIGNSTHSYQATNSPGAQVGASVVAIGNRVRIETVDFSQILPQITELRNFYGRTANAEHIEQRLSELEHLMAAGAPAPADKSHVQKLATELSTILQGYPPLVQLFQHVAQLVGG